MSSNKVEPSSEPTPVRQFDNVEPSFRLRWSNLKYVRGQGAKVKVIFDNLNGLMCSGTLTAIMGPSGAGKSTLLDCLAEKRIKGRSGRVFIESTNMTQIKVAMIPQHDNYYEVLTVKECLIFSSRLYTATEKKRHGKAYLRSIVIDKLDHQQVEAEKGKKVSSLRHFHENMADKVLEMLGLSACSAVLAGSISGGQQKRLSIAQELVSRPNVLFLDEPTSGLDSSATQLIVELLQNLSTQKPPMAIMATIHQPSARVFNMFHKVIMLAKNGKIVYDGLPGDVTSTLSLADPSLECPNFCNPADFLIEVASGEYGADKIALLDVSRQSEMGTSSGVVQGCGQVKTMKEAMKAPRYPSFVHFFILLVRCFLLILRDPVLMSLRLGSHLSVAIFVGYLFGPRIGTATGCPPDLRPPAAGQGFNPNILLDFRSQAMDEMRNLMDNFSNLFFNILIILFSGMMPVLLTFPMEMSIFVKETNNRAYGPGVYYLAKMLADIPFQIFFPTMYTGITYYMNGQVFDSWRFSCYLAILILTGLIGQSIGLIFGTLFMRSPMNAVFLAPLSALPMFLFSGFLVKLENMPEILRPFTWTSSVRFSMEGVLIALFGHGRCTADPRRMIVTKHFFTRWLVSMFSGQEGTDYDYDPQVNETDKLDPEMFGSLVADSLMGGVGGVSLVDNNGHAQSAVMGLFSLYDDHLNVCFVMLVLNLVVFRFIVYVLIIWRANQKK